MARVAWIIGNGPSRKGVDLNDLDGTTFGCNALYRDFTPDYLLSGDAGVIKEICSTDYPKNNKCIFPDWNPIPVEYEQALLEEFRHGKYEIYNSNLDNLINLNSQFHLPNLHILTHQLSYFINPNQNILLNLNS